MPIPTMTFEDQKLQDFMGMSEPMTDTVEAPPQSHSAPGESAPVESASVPVVPQPLTADVPAAVGVSRETYDAAWVEHSHRDFAQRIAQARAPVVRVPVAPCIAPRIAETTRLEMEAGAARVAQFAVAEQQRRVIPRKKEPWEGNNTPIFRPIDFIPDPRRAPGNSPVTVAVT